MALTMDQIWSQLCAKDPKLLQDDHEVTFISTNLKRLLQQIYDQGRVSAGNTNKSLMEDVFGKGFKL